MPSNMNCRASRRLRREQRTLNVMVHMYCAGNHRGAGPGNSDAERKDVFCERCSRLLAYAEQRIDRCRFGDDKPTCARCTVHCFQTDMREQVREVMRYSGPRMTFRHPYLALRHLFDRRRTPDRGIRPANGVQPRDKGAD